MKLRFLGAVVVTVLFVYFLLPSIDGSLLLKKLQNISFFELLLGFVALIIANVIRTFRFKTMDTCGGRFSRWWHINQTYNTLTTLLPGGGGEIATAYVMQVASDNRGSIFRAIRILIFSRLMDLFFYSMFLLVAAVFFVNNSEYSREAIGAAIVFAAVAWLALTPFVEKKLLYFIERFLVKRFKIFERFRSQLTDLIDVSDMQHKQGTVKLAIVQSFLVVLSAAMAVYFTMLSLGMTILWYQGFFCLGLFSLFQLIPLQGVAGIGTQAAWWSFSITASGYKANDVIVAGVMLHVIFLLFILIMFLPSFFYIFSKKDLEPIRN